MTENTAPQPVGPAPAAPADALTGLVQQWRWVLLVLLGGAGVGGFGNQALNADPVASTLEAIKVDIAVLKNDVSALKDRVEKCK